MKTKVNTRAIVVATACILAIVMLITDSATTVKHDRENWNHGHCTRCGAKWELVATMYRRHGFDGYYWKCPNCGEFLITHSILEN